ncbi:MAG: V-type ATP synthase subunit F [Eubacteriales bacterium]|nr:V-type ATP synthase subunit F [Eubacteriales bacterium]
MCKIAVIGDYDSVYGFAALGIEIFPVSDPVAAGEKLHRLATEYGVIYITEHLAAGLQSEIEKYADRVTPAIIQIPGTSGNTGEGIRGVRRCVEKAVGSDILFGS